MREENGPSNSEKCKMLQPQWNISALQFIYGQSTVVHEIILAVLFLALWGSSLPNKVFLICSIVVKTGESDSSYSAAIIRPYTGFSKVHQITITPPVPRIYGESYVPMLFVNQHSSRVQLPTEGRLCAFQWCDDRPQTTQLHCFSIFTGSSKSTQAASYTFLTCYADGRLCCVSNLSACLLYFEHLKET